MSDTMTEEAVVKSPCISICVLNEGDICEGCYRSAQEITDWTELSNPQKEQVLLKVNERFKDLNKHLLL
jgi:predicted Fe-S protein YdhL (DUF1289 family)